MRPRVAQVMFVMAALLLLATVTQPLGRSESNIRTWHEEEVAGSTHRATITHQVTRGDYGVWSMQDHITGLSGRYLGLDAPPKNAYPMTEFYDATRGDLAWLLGPALVLSMVASVATLVPRLSVRDRRIAAASAFALAVLADFVLLGEIEGLAARVADQAQREAAEAATDPVTGAYTRVHLWMGKLRIAGIAQGIGLIAVWRTPSMAPDSPLPDLQGEA